MERFNVSAILLVWVLFILIVAGCAEVQRQSLDAEAYYDHGNAWMSKGDYDRAISDFNKALEIEPRLAQAYSNRGNAYYLQDKHDKAIADYNKAIEMNPWDIGAYASRGDAYRSKGQYDRAIADCNKAIEIKSSFAWAYFIRGDAYFGKGQYDQAIADYNKALEINPKLAEQKVSACNQALEINPKDAETYYNRGIAYFSNREYEKAWDDVYKAQNLGYKVNSLFLNALRQASGKQKLSKG